MKKYEPNFKRLDELTTEGYLRKVISPCGRLMLYNYTDKCTYEGKWSKHTLNARGTVYELSTGRVVARAFPKFFNFSELQPIKQKMVLKSQSFETFEKMDGSLGIVYYYDGEWRVNTRGSFKSDQAVKGKQMLDVMLQQGLLVNEDCTFLVEIIYPQNKIIVNYGQEEKLTLLACFSTEDGTELKLNYNFELIFDNAYFTLPEKSDFNSITTLQSHLATLDHTEEGYVVRLEDGSRVKFKSKAYLDVARLKGNMTPLAFWKCMEMGKVKVDFIEQLPEEFREEADKLMKQIEEKYRHLSMQLSIEFKANFISESTTRKDIGIISKEKGLNSGAMFAILDGKVDVLDKIVMKNIRPFANQL